MKPTTLTEAEVEHFLQKGYVTIKDAFPKSLAAEWAADCFRRLGYDPNERSTWKEPRIHMGGDRHLQVREVAPRVYGAICDLLGGEDRVGQPVTWSDHFIVNLGLRAEEEWSPPGPHLPGWHKDGDFFRHFLDSPEQGLLVFVNWTDVVHRGGPTYVATDSVPVVARYLAARPEGVLPNDLPFRELIKECREFTEAVGEAGDVTLLHPFVLHAASQNPLRAIRIITNPPVNLKEPMRFDREDPSDFSPVERGVLRGLGVDRYEFRPTSPRERVVPERVKRQQAMMAGERAAGR